MDREYNGVEYRLILRVEGAIDENAVVVSLYLRFGAARGPRARTRPFGIDYFDLPATFFADFLMACAALLARWTSAFFATGEDFIVRTRIVISRGYASRLVLSILAP
jgi:hypothetical protein